MKNLAVALFLLMTAITHTSLTQSMTCFCDACVSANYDAIDGIDYATKGE